ncbi:hypothetical protein EH11_02568 [Bacillus subtilis]|nr:hypothetical protein EH11_02568 [Bacillus subtilis]RUS06466.1 hypothetical protein EFW59_02579 [Bacillus subtilis]
MSSYLFKKIDPPSIYPFFLKKACFKHCIKTVIDFCNLLYYNGITTKGKEGLVMLGKITEFFRNLPSKKCAECGKKIEEQHECYGNICNDCIKVNDL